jgi:hypothetical protein
MKMKRVAQLISVVWLTVIGTISMYCQYGPHEKFISKPATGTVVYLDTIITNDTLVGVSGQVRADSQRVYVLERGGLWYVKSAIVNPGWPINIKAGTGTARKPKIYLYCNPTTGTWTTYGFNIQGNINLSNLLIDGQDGEADQNNIARFIIGVNRSGVDVVVDSCIFNNVRSAHIQTLVAARVVKATNCVFANAGWAHGSGNIGDGRAIDIRNMPCDTLLCTNNTFVNIYDRVIRHFTSLTPMKSFIFDHNTCVNVAGFLGFISLSTIGDSTAAGRQGHVQFSNNLLVDHFALGNDTDSYRKEWSEAGELNDFVNPSLSYWRMTSLYCLPDSTNFSVKYDFFNNYYSVTPALQALWDSVHAVDPVFLGAPYPFTHYIERQAGTQTTTAFKKDSITLTATPLPMVPLVTWYRKSASLGGAGKTTSNTGLQDMDRRMYTYFRDTLNCAYTSTLASTGADRGLHAGDLNWYPSELATWLANGGVTEIEKSNSVAVPSVFALNQNYPNPFNPSTNLNYQVGKTGIVSLKVYDILGRVVTSLVNEVKPAGTYTITWNAGRLSSGIYFCRMQSGAFSATQKLLLMK